MYQHRESLQCDCTSPGYCKYYSASPLVVCVCRDDMDKQKPYNATKKVCIKLSKSIAEEKLCDNESDYIKS